MPKYVMVGDSTTLKCHFNLEHEKLYTLTWWKDDRQFYQYIPKNDPKIVIFTVPGVTVVVSVSLFILFGKKAVIKLMYRVLQKVFFKWLRKVF